MMILTPSRIALFLALMAVGRVAQAAAPASGPAGAQPQAFSKPPATTTASPADNPAIANPNDQFSECDTEAARRPQDPAHPRPLVRPCINQADALKRASEASSYLAFYLENYSDYGLQIKDADQRAKIKADVALCLSGSAECQVQGTDQVHDEHAKKLQGRLMAALVQYNFGKDVRANLLDTRSRARGMQSMDIPAQERKALGISKNYIVSNATDRGTKGKDGPVDKKRSTSHGASGLTESFKLNPKYIQAYEADKASPGDRAYLGSQFNQFFEGFVNEYTSSSGQRGLKSRWNFVAVKSAAVSGSGEEWVIGPKRPSSGSGLRLGDEGRLKVDAASQKNPVVDEIVDSYKKRFLTAATSAPEEVKVTDDTDPSGATMKKVKVDAMPAAYEAMGFGLSRDYLKQMENLPHPPGTNIHEVTGINVALALNKAVYDTEKGVKDKDSQNLAQNGGGNQFARAPSSASDPSDPASVAAKVVPSVSVSANVAAFDAYLDEIWPPSAPKTN